MKRFPAHGSMRMQTLGRILHVEIDGPWNLELIDLYRETAAPEVLQLAARGPWALIIEIHGAALCPFDAVEAIRRGVREQAHDRRRVCTAYVIAPEVEGAGLTEPVWRGIYAGVMPFELFETLDEALRWSQAQLDGAA